MRSHATRVTLTPLITCPAVRPEWAPWLESGPTEVKGTGWLESPVARSKTNLIYLS